MGVDRREFELTVGGECRRLERENAAAESGQFFGEPFDNSYRQTVKTVARAENSEPTMRIDPLGTPPPLQKPTAGSAPRAAAPADAPAAETGFAPTSELAALLMAVSQSPEVRADVIESVAARLVTGEFDTPQAAADAARALLADVPAPPGE
jgi:hypothetical protein